MTNEELELEISHLATKEALEKLRGDLHKDFGDFKADLIKTIWITQLSTIGIILVAIGITNAVLYFALAKIHA